MIDDCRYLVVGTDTQEFRVMLLALGDIDRMHPIGQSNFFKHNGDLAPVQGTPGVQIQAVFRCDCHDGKSLQRAE